MSFSRSPASFRCARAMRIPAYLRVVPTIAPMWYIASSFISREPPVRQKCVRNVPFRASFRCFRRIPAARCVRASRPLISSLTAARKQAEEALRRAHDELETRVQDNLYHKRVRDFEILHGRNPVTAKDCLGGNNPAPPISKGDLWTRL